MRTVETHAKVVTAEKFGRVEVQEDGDIVLTIVTAEGEEVGFMMPPNVADEMTGALIERSPGSREVLGEVSSPDDADFHVTSVEELLPEDEKFVFRLKTDKGPSLTFRFGSRQVRRWRDALSAQIARHQFRMRQ